MGPACVACYRATEEVRIDSLESCGRFHVTLRRHRQLHLIRVEIRGYSRHGAVLVPAALLAPGFQVVPLRRLGKLDAQNGCMNRGLSDVPYTLPSGSFLPLLSSMAERPILTNTLSCTIRL